MKTFFYVTGIGLVFILVIALLASPGDQNTVGAAEYGADWPLTVDSGVLACRKSAATIRASGTTYALNGTARQAGHTSIEPIWKTDQVIAGQELKKSLGPLIKAANALCD
ncbi:DUF2511 domain-containing protein [Falsirhodobacter halotolerans]|uniref:DUF2511 domain-containing protein n=1 Tax=Falsirhodobacter halotolerans TaxID=1146892 RepID=UPI001FCFD0B0|nr:DUF2511 domain-containing protein [Falsirhodobacter halotolerans]MCJ8138435.1 YebY family protein [Falsirhodobacter halotolerans]